MTLLSLARVALVCALMPGLSFAAPNPGECPTADDSSGSPAPLPRVAPALKPGRTLEVLAIGSATLFGPEASLSPGTIMSQALSGSSTATVTGPQLITKEASERAFPHQMVKSLRAQVPGADIRITIRGGRGLPAADMLTLMRSELPLRPYQLVIWQTGTVEAVRNLPPSEFGQTLSDGLELATAANANLVLVDPQFSRFLQTNSNLEPYVQALQQVSSLPGAVLFRRFDITRTWAIDGQIDLERASKGERQKVVEALHACLGRHLGRLVLESARMGPPLN